MKNRLIIPYTQNKQQKKFFKKKGKKGEIYNINLKTRKSKISHSIYINQATKERKKKVREINYKPLDKSKIKVKRTH